MEASSHRQTVEANALNIKTHDKDFFVAAPGVYGLKTLIVNLYFVEAEGGWVLIDTGMYGYAHKIAKVAKALFGENSRPKAILLTHGHFDHVGAVKELAAAWDVPVYAHQLELPYLTGKSSYPPPDPTVGGGGMAYMSFMYPKKPINIENNVELLPEDGSVPGLPGWSWHFTPGHSPGHVSFFRDSDRTLIAGDAFVTRHGESAIAVMTQKREVHGPPAYFTADWVSAHHSVEKLAKLAPETAATGHGLPMYGQELHDQLEDLVSNFWVKAVPRNGRYVNEPAVADEFGVISVPGSTQNVLPKALIVAGAVTVLGGLALTAMRRKNNKVRTASGTADMAESRPFSHNRVASGIPPAIDPDFDDPKVHTNNYP